MSARVVLWHPKIGIFYRLWFGMQACSGSSTDAEWLAKIALLFALGDWAGDVLLATDSTAALMADLISPPPPPPTAPTYRSRSVRRSSACVHASWKLAFQLSTIPMTSP